MHALGSFVLAAIVVICSAAVFAAILALTLSFINDIVKKGSDPNQDGMAAALIGLFIGAIFGGGISIKLSLAMAVGDVVTSMLGYAFVAVILAVIAVHTTKKLVAK